MPSNRTIALIGVLLVAVASLAATGPAMAHSGAPIAAPALAAPETTTSPMASGAATEESPASDSPGLTPWIAAGVLLVAGFALRRLPRRTLLLSLVLLLTLFAFENALHSVHHGLDPKEAGACPIAMASAQLSAVAVDDAVGPQVTLVAAGHATSPDRSLLPVRWLASDQGRAPPAA